MVTDLNDLIKNGNGMGKRLRWSKVKTSICVCAHCTQLSATSWTIALQAPLSMEITGMGSFPPPGDLPNPGVKSMSLASPEFQADFLPLAPPGKLGIA